MECLRLLLKDFSDGLDGVTVVELEGEWVSLEVYPRLDLVLVQSRLKEVIEGRGLREGSHVMSKEDCMADRS